MKTRNGYVSNSSSSSFVIDRKYVSDYQLEKLENHLEESKKFLDEVEEFYNEKYDGWNIRDYGDEIRGSTSMDNFDMHRFMKLIGIPTEHVVWGDY